MDSKIVLSKPLRRYRKFTDIEHKELADLPSDWIPFVQKGQEAITKRDREWAGLQSKFRRQMWLVWWLQKVLRLPSVLLRPLVRT